MAPVSILPGRIRLETLSLIGRFEECDRLHRRLMTLAGVREVSANVRTGRILVRFDEAIVRREDLLSRIEQILSGTDQQEAEHLVSGKLVSGKPILAKSGLSSQVARHLLVDAVAHAVLPGPLQLLVPAVAAFRR